MVSMAISKNAKYIYALGAQNSGSTIIRAGTIIGTNIWYICMVFQVLVARDD